MVGHPVCGLAGQYPISGCDAADLFGALESVARGACVALGLLYLLVGVIPVGLGLAGNVMLDGEQEHTRCPSGDAVSWPRSGDGLRLDPAVGDFIDHRQRITRPMTMLANDILPAVKKRPMVIAWVRWSVALIIGLVSAWLAYLGESAYALLESGYELGMVSLMAPLVYAVFSKRGGPLAMAASMASGTLLWIVHMMNGWQSFFGATELRCQGLGCTIVSFLVYPLVAAITDKPTRLSQSQTPSP